MREMKFTMRLDKFKDVSIKIFDEELFAKKYNEYWLENRYDIQYNDMIGEDFQNCVEVIFEESDFIFESFLDEYYEKIGGFVGLYIDLEYLRKNGNKKCK